MSRPIMCATELRSYHAEDFGRDYRFSDDGYSDMEHEGKSGWRAVAGWGRDGWDLGDWPYVSFLVRKQEGEERPYQLMQIVEGDRSVWAFPSQDDLHAAIDYLFLWYAANGSNEEWCPVSYEQREQLDAGTLEIDPKFRGPYSRFRADKVEEVQR